MADSNSAPPFLFSATQHQHTNIISNFTTHCSQPRLDTDFHLYSLIRETYPNHHVTNVVQAHISLIEFANAGKATLSYDTSSITATRSWKSVGNDVEKKLHHGRLSDQFRLVRFLYVWEGNEFLVYHAHWADAFKAPEYRFYILYPRGTDNSSSSNIVDGHCQQTDALCLAAGKWTAQLHNEIWVFDDGKWSKSKELWRSVNGSSWADVILDPAMKKSLVDDVHGFFDSGEVYRSFSVPWKRGIIFHGFPGNGKTVSIKALMSALYARHDSISCLYVKSLKSLCQTQHYSVRLIFERARKIAPCLLVFEDLDSLVVNEIRSYFLNEVDGLESNNGILMIGSTNHLDRLDPAIAKRPSRFDRKYNFKLPGEEERRMYAEYWRQKLMANGTVEFPEELCPVIAKLTEGFSFAYLKELFVVTLLSLVRGFTEGDDFEMVEATEEEKAAAATSGEVQNGSAKPGNADEKVETCICSQKCGTCHLPFDATPKKQDDNSREAALKEPQKHAMPAIDVPQHLAENPLLKALKHHIRILLLEMDNTVE